AFGISFHPETIDVPLEIVIVHLEHIGGDHLRFGLNLAAGHCGRRARYRRRARTVGAETIGRRVGIALFYGDVVSWQTKFSSDDLGVGCLVPLALRFGAEPANARAGGMNADFRRVEHGDAENIAGARWAGADDLGKKRDADTHQLASLAALECSALGLLLLAELFVVDRLHRLFQGRLVVA